MHASTRQSVDLPGTVVGNAKSQHHVECGSPALLFRVLCRLETWGLECRDDTLLPLGVDYEAPARQKRQIPFGCLNAGRSHCGAGTATTVEGSLHMRKASSKKLKGIRNDETAPVAREWQPANAFVSIPPEVGSALTAPETAHGDSQWKKDAFGPVGNLAATEGQGVAAEAEPVYEFGGMRLLPLKHRPYYKEGFVRVPPLPNQGAAAHLKSRYAGEADRLLEKLQELQQLSRFDSFHSLKEGCASASRVVVFRRAGHNGVH